MRAICFSVIFTLSMAVGEYVASARPGAFFPALQCKLQLMSQERCECGSGVEAIIVAMSQPGSNIVL